MSNRGSPVLDVTDDIDGDSPVGSPTTYFAKRPKAAQNHSAAAEQQQNDDFDRPLLVSSASHQDVESGVNENRSFTQKKHHHHHHHSHNNNNNKKDRSVDNNDHHRDNANSHNNSHVDIHALQLAADDHVANQIAQGFTHSGNLHSHHHHLMHPGTLDERGNLLNAQGALLHPHTKKVVTTANDAYESLNYDEIENIPLQEERMKHGGSLEPATWKIWIILLICGAVTGLVAFAIDEGQGYLAKLKFQAVEYFMMSDNTSSSANNSFHFGNNHTTSGQISNYDALHISAAVLIFIFINLAYVLVAAAVVVFGEPVAKGSGIPEVKCYLNGVRIWRVVRLKTMVVKACGILFAVASGLPVGKEGPMIHAGAAIASGISTGKSSLMRLDTGLFKEFRSDAYKRAFITAGAAAGVGAAFGAPIGGIIFAIEEVGSYWNIELTVMVFLCAAVAPWTLQLLLHPDGLESGKTFGLIDFGVMEGSYSYRDIPFLVALGISCGGLGAIFIYLNILITKWRKIYVNTKWKKLIEVVIISLCVSGVLIFLVLYAYDCVKIESATSTTQSAMKQYGCEADEFNDMATYFFVELEKSISLLIHEPRAVHIRTLAKQFVPMYFLTIVTYGINVPSGLFLPSLALGANFGHMFAQLMNMMIPGLALNPAHFALFGGTGMLAGNLRMTISVVAIVMEATGNATFFYPLAIIVMCAKFFGDIFNKGIFDEHIGLAKIPLLLSKTPQPEMAMMDASEIMNKIPAQLPGTCTVRTLLQVLKQYSYHSTYVVVDEDDGKFRGLLLRRTALILIDKEAWKNVLTYDDFIKTGKERSYISVKKYGVLERPQDEDMDQEIDLLRYCDLWPHVFHVSTPVPRVYRTFRELGLRHIIVVDDDNRPVGLIGRRQLCYLEVTEKEKPVNAGDDDEESESDDDARSGNHTTSDLESEVGVVAEGSNINNNNNNKFSSGYEGGRRGNNGSNLSNTNNGNNNNTNNRNSSSSSVMINQQNLINGDPHSSADMSFQEAMGGGNNNRSSSASKNNRNAASFAGYDAYRTAKNSDYRRKILRASANNANNNNRMSDYGTSGNNNDAGRQFSSPTQRQ